MNKKGFSIANLLLIVGVLILAISTLISFYSSNQKVLTSFIGIGTIEKLNARIEENAFYNVKIIDTVKEPVKEEVNLESRGSLYGAVLYAQDNSPIIGRNLKCGDKCFEYASIIEKYAPTYNIDPVLFFSLMMQESQGVASADSGSSVGLMQVNLDNCGSYDLPSNKQECEILLKTNVEKNIEVGMKVLNEKYLQFRSGRVFQGCSEKNIRYVEWAAALRGYNGWGCGCDTKAKNVKLKDRCSIVNQETGETVYGKKIYSQDSFVEDVIRRQGALKGTYSEAVVLKDDLTEEIKEPFFSVRLLE
jgi:hypothetical protein